MTNPSIPNLHMRSYRSKQCKFQHNQSKISKIMIYNFVPLVIIVNLKSRMNDQNYTIGEHRLKDANIKENTLKSVKYMDVYDILKE